MTFEVPTLHEIHPAPRLIKKVIDWEKGKNITIEVFIFDALYFNKEILEHLSGHKYIIRVPAHNWLLQHIDKGIEKGSKEIILWGQKVTYFGGKQENVIKSMIS